MIAFIESLVVVGFFLPGILILFGIGALLGMGEGEVWAPIWIGGTLGAFCGDLLSFWIGHRYQLHLRRMWPFSRYPGNAACAAWCSSSGTAQKSVLAGRFIGPLRPVIPTTAGMMGMSLAGHSWPCASRPASSGHPAYLVPGMLFGASLEVASASTPVASPSCSVWRVGILWLACGSFDLRVCASAPWQFGALDAPRHPLVPPPPGPRPVRGTHHRPVASRRCCR